MALSDSQRKANDKYIASHYSRIALSVPNDEAKRIEDFCEKHGYTKAGFIRRAVFEAIEREDGQQIEK